MEDYASQLEDFRWRMDSQLVHIGMDKALGKQYSVKMTMLDVALQEFRGVAVELQHIGQVRSTTVGRDMPFACIRPSTTANAR